MTPFTDFLENHFGFMTCETFSYMKKFDEKIYSLKLKPQPHNEQKSIEYAF